MVAENGKKKFREKKIKKIVKNCQKKNSDDEELSEFDKIWNILPHISSYQIRISGLAGYGAFVTGFMGIYPVFAQYKPPTRCETVFDKNFTDYNLTWNQIHELTSNTPECVGYSSDDSTECYYCNFKFEDLSDCGKTYEELQQESVKKF